MKSIPVLAIEGASLAGAWEKSLLALYERGCRFKTEYDKEHDPRSIDATMCLTVADPAAEPRIHRSFPGSLEFLEEYCMEVIDGIKDQWIRDRTDPDDTRWEYTYHERLFRYSFNDDTGERRETDQVEYIVDKLARSPHSRRAQAITWKVWEDLNIDDPACLQSIWCRVMVDDEGVWWLNMNVRMRSNDAYEAAFMNMFAFIALQERIAQKIAERVDCSVKPGRYVHFADSYHIYGKRLDDFEQRFLRAVNERSFEQRTWTMDFAREIMEPARPHILEKVRRENEKFA